MAEWNPRVNEIFAHAILESAADRREAFLKDACAADADLRRRVDALLRAHEAASGFLQGPGGSTFEATIDRTLKPEAEPAIDVIQHLDETLETMIGPYKLREKIGEGGMGVVYIAEQEKPVRRRVALKIIKPGMDTAQVVARFEAERQALAMMDHPSIAKVFDAGATGAGRPYFVMELVKGVPITEYCDTVHLNPKERLELFIPVCQAIQHAHQKGIIHRDVKPSNVLIAMQDGKPVPKVIDFGIAKATAQRLTEKSLFTQHGTIVGTLEYMSPEQAEMSALDVDTRTDVYALGVLLYELLTGTTPLERARLRHSGYAEILKRIREEEPPKPSTRLTDSSESLASVAVLRRTDPARLARTVRGDLDWIVMKALEKDRTRRYETANGFARDIQRHLDGDAVEACPPSARYRLGKFARRHRAALATAASFALLLAGATAVSMGLAWWANKERVRAVAARGEAQESAERERAALKIAQARLVQVEQANDLLASIFRDLDPRLEEKEGKPLRILLGERLDKVAQQLDAQAEGDPLTVAKLQNILGTTQVNLGRANEAIVGLTRARRLDEERLGPRHPLTLACRNELAAAYQAVGRNADALKLEQETLKLRAEILGRDHADTLESLNNVGVFLQTAGRTLEAIVLFEETIELVSSKRGRETTETLSNRSNLARAYLQVGRTKDSIALNEVVLKRRTAMFGSDHTDTILALNDLGQAYQADDRTDEAIALHKRALEVSTEKLGLDHPTTLTCMGNLASSYNSAGRYPEAIATGEKARKVLTATRGANHVQTLSCLSNLASSYAHSGRLIEAIAMFEDVRDRFVAAVGKIDHPGRDEDAGECRFGLPADWPNRRGYWHPGTFLRTVRDPTWSGSSCGIQ